MSKKLSSKSVVDSARTIVMENQSLQIPKGVDGVSPRGRHRRGSEQLNVDVPLGTRDRLGWLADLFGAKTCTVVHSLIDTAYVSLQGKAKPILMSKENYIFIDLTLQPLTVKVRRQRDRLVKEDEILTEIHGRKDKCFFCDNKPIEKVFSWNEPSPDTPKCHVTYVCKQHLKPELQRLQQLRLLRGHGPI